MADEQSRRISTTPIPVPFVIPGSLASAVTAPSPLSQSVAPADLPTASPSSPPPNLPIEASAMNTPMTNPTADPSDEIKDTTMIDAANGTELEQPSAVPATPATPASRASPAPARAGAQQAEPGFTVRSKPAAHGSEVRQYLNKNVVGPLNDGLKILAVEKPTDPLRVLGEYLIQRSKELSVNPITETDMST